MKHSIQRACLLVLVLVAASAQAAHAGPPAPAVPTDIAVPDGNKPFLVGHAAGVQIYQCGATASGYAWTLRAPRASLYDDHGKLLAVHYAGPTWQARDGSTVVGGAVKRVTVDPDAIPWLRVAASSTAAGVDGDRLAGTTYVQRIETVGGLPPAGGCDAAAAGTTAEIPYTADYVFWKALDGNA